MHMFPPLNNAGASRPRRPWYSWLSLIVSILSTIATIYIFLVVFDFAMIVPVYSWFSNRMAAMGVPEGLNGFFAIWLAVGIVLSFWKMLWAIIRRDKTAILQIAGAVSVYFLFTFGAISYWTMTTNPTFSVFTGRSNFRCAKDGEGVIHRYPLSFTNDDSGEALEVCTPAIAKEYKKQQKALEAALKAEKLRQQGALEQQKAQELARKASEVKATLTPDDHKGWFAKLFGRDSANKMAAVPEIKTTQEPEVKATNQKVAEKGPNYVTNDSPGINLSMWVEKIEFAPDRIVLHMAVHVVRGSAGTLWSVRKSGSTYLVDNDGSTYEWRNDNVRYESSSETDEWGNHNSAHTYVKTRTIREDEILRFVSTFSPANHAISKLKLYSEKFPPLTLDNMIASAAHIEAEPKPVAAEAAKQIELVTKPVVAYARFLVYTPGVLRIPTLCNCALTVVSVDLKEDRTTLLMRGERISTNIEMKLLSLVSHDSRGGLVPKIVNENGKVSYFLSDNLAHDAQKPFAVSDEDGMEMYFSTHSDSSPVSFEMNFEAFDPKGHAFKLFNLPLAWKEAPVEIQFSNVTP